MDEIFCSLWRKADRKTNNSRKSEADADRSFGNMSHNRLAEFSKAAYVMFPGTKQEKLSAIFAVDENLSASWSVIMSSVLKNTSTLNLYSGN
jgi:hypothetical protein